MPSKGNPVVAGRISKGTAEDLEVQLELSAIYRRSGPYTVASFIESAVREKLQKMMRGRRPRKKDIAERNELAIDINASTSG